ncbi:MAG: Crp/Fnr family transcriptional regulator [Bauldia sp.]
MARHVTRRRYAAHAPIFHAGDDGESLMGVLSGSVRISRPTADGEDIILADFGPGEVFGEIAVLDGRGRSADATATLNTELFILERRDLLGFLRERPELYVNLLSLLCAKIRIADERTSDLVFLDLRGRLAKALLARTADGGTNRTSLTQSDLARVIGGTRSNVNRQLKAWERDGLIRQDKGWIVVVDRMGLGAEAR